MITTGRCGSCHNRAGTRSLRKGQITRAAWLFSICWQTASSSLNSTTLGTCPASRSSNQARWVKPLNADASRMIFNERMTELLLEQYAGPLLQRAIHGPTGAATVKRHASDTLTEVNRQPYGGCGSGPLVSRLGFLAHGVARLFSGLLNKEREMTAVRLAERAYRS